MPETNIFNKKDPNAVHAFIQIGSYSTAKGRSKTKFKILYNFDPRELEKIIEGVLREALKK